MTHHVEPLRVAGIPPTTRPACEHEAELEVALDQGKVRHDTLSAFNLTSEFLSRRKNDVNGAEINISMRDFLSIVESTLTEMIVRHRSAGGSLVVAHRGSIWVLDRDEDESEALEDIATRTGLKADSVDDLHELADERPDVLVADIWKDELFLGYSRFGQNPETSLLFKKVVQQLGLKGVRVSTVTSDGDDEEITFDRHELQGKIPELVFHGTCSIHIRAILRTGLVPESGNRNWEKFRFPRVFMTASFAEATFHANRTAKAHKGHPVVIATRIPDRSKIGFDFDVAARFVTDLGAIDRHGYTTAMGHVDRASADEIAKFSPKTDYTREAGTFSYDGRVPASFFVSFTISSEAGVTLNPDRMKNITLTDPKDLVRAIDMLDDLGYYDPDYMDDEDDVR